MVKERSSSWISIWTGHLNKKSPALFSTGLLAKVSTDSALLFEHLTEENSCYKDAKGDQGSCSLGAEHVE